MKIYSQTGFCQSGVLWVPSDNSDNVFVFTVSHGILGCAEQLNIDFWQNSGEKNLLVNKVLFPPDSSIDCAVLIIPTRSMHLLPSTYELLTLNDYEHLANDVSSPTVMQFWGYPKLRLGYTSSNQLHHFPCVAGDEISEDENTKTFIVSYDDRSRLDPSDPNPELEGCSGGGLFATLNDKIFLCGIYRGTPTEAGHYRDLSFISLHTFQDICIKNGIPFPSYQSLVPDSLKKQLRICQDEISKEHVLNDSLLDVSDYNYAKLIHSSCGKCIPCEYKAYFYLCDQFQQQLLYSSALLRYQDNSFTVCEPLKVHIGEECYDVRIICSDIRPARVSKLIQALKQDYLGENMLSENTLVLWVTKEGFRGIESSCTRSEYKKIVRDIADVRLNRFDYSCVNEAPEQLAILNVSYIVYKLESDPNAFYDFLKRM